MQSLLTPQALNFKKKGAYIMFIIVCCVAYLPTPLLAEPIVRPPFRDRLPSGKI